MGECSLSAPKEVISEPERISNLSPTVWRGDSGRGGIHRGVALAQGWFAFLWLLLLRSDPAFHVFTKLTL